MVGLLTVVEGSAVLSDGLLELAPLAQLVALLAEPRRAQFCREPSFHHLLDEHVGLRHSTDAHITLAAHLGVPRTPSAQGVPAAERDRLDGHPFARHTPQPPVVLPAQARRGQHLHERGDDVLEPVRGHGRVPGAEREHVQGVEQPAALHQRVRVVQVDLGTRLHVC